jgi:hypothetical protein
VATIVLVLVVMEAASDVNWPGGAVTHYSASQAFEALLKRCLFKVRPLAEIG